MNIYTNTLRISYPTAAEFTLTGQLCFFEQYFNIEQWFSFFQKIVFIRRINFFMILIALIYFNNQFIGFVDYMIMIKRVQFMYLNFQVNKDQIEKL